MKKIKLNQLAIEKLQNQEMKLVIGGYVWRDDCGCGCYYAGSGGSSTSANKNANYAGALVSIARAE